MTDVPPHGTDSPSHGLAFLELGERLRQRGQLAAAATVAESGLAHYPGSAAAYDLLGRIRADQGNDPAARAAWHAALECDPNHVGAQKGMAFVAFREHDFATAERHLARAAAHAPHDTSVLAALDRVRSAQRRLPGAEALKLDDPASGLLLYDLQGMRLAGTAGDPPDDLTADAVAAEAAGLSRESARVARLLGLGQLRQVIIESADARIAVLPLDADAALLLHRTHAMPLGRLLALAARAAHAARQWLERMK